MVVCGLFFGAEKLVCFYFRYICLIKNFLKDVYDIDIINNIEDFPIYDDKSMKENYDAICKVVKEVDKKPNFIKGKFYVQKVNTIYSKGKIFYENRNFGLWSCGFRCS